MYVYVLERKRRNKTNIYSIDCNPNRSWFLENDITAEFKTSRYSLLIKQSNTIDEELLNYKNKKLIATKKVMEEKFKDKIIFRINDLNFNPDNFKYGFSVYSPNKLVKEFGSEVMKIVNDKSGVMKYIESLGVSKNIVLESFFVHARNRRRDMWIMDKVFDTINHQEHIITVAGETFHFICYVYFKEYEKEIISDECVICLTEKSTQYFPSCGHLCICKECKLGLEESIEVKCPLCRKINRIIINKK